MAKNNRHRKHKEQQKPVSQAPKPPSPTAQAPSPTPKAVPSTRPSADSAPKSSPWASPTFLLPLFISILSLAGTLWNYGVNQRNQDRVSGRVRAKFEFVDLNRTDPSLMKPTERGEIFRLDNLSEMVQWAPHVTIKNTGDELIDSIKIEVACLIGAAYGPGVEQKHPRPYFINEVTTREMSSFGKFPPGKKASISLLPVLLDQMMQSK